MKSRYVEEKDCQPFDGPEKRWRERAIAIAWEQLGIEQPQLSWPSPTCGTALCLTFDHLIWESAKSLAYPPGVCTYCGMPANTVDHLLPVTWTGLALRRHVLTVPACVQCNSAITDRYCMAIDERRRIAHNYIARKNKKLLKMREWKESEIKRLGPTLRSSVRRGMFDRNIALARLAWPEDPDYDIRAMHLAGIANPYEIGLLTEANLATEGAKP